MTGDPRPPQPPPFPPPRGPSGTPYVPTPAVPPGEPSSFRRTLVRVMAVQVASLLLLWLLQSRYTP